MVSCVIILSNKLSWVVNQWYELMTTAKDVIVSLVCIIKQGNSRICYELKSLEIYYLERKQIVLWHVIRVGNSKIKHSDESDRTLFRRENWRLTNLDFRVGIIDNYSSTYWQVDDNCFFFFNLSHGLA